MTISAKMIEHSISPAGIALATLQLRYPKFIHGEFMTHRVFSRNASSSRAIPVERLIQDIIADPVVPMFWGANQPGMSADEECTNTVKWEIQGWFGPALQSTREEAWDRAKVSAITTARAYAAAGYHKQIVNRLLEPFSHINVVVTASDWRNFFALRCHSKAQPEMRILAEMIRVALITSQPKPLEPGEWHLPYVLPEECAATGADPDQLIKLSVARCARVSYLTQEGKPPNATQDLALYERLVGGDPDADEPLHASPAEHQATPDERVEAPSEWLQASQHGNLRGWRQYRKMLPNEYVPG